MSYHDNKLNMIGLDDDDGDFEYKPAKKSGKKSDGIPTKSSKLPTKSQKPMSVSTATKRKRGSTSNTPAKTPKKPNISTGNSPIPYSVNFHNSPENFDYAGAQFMIPPGSDRGQLSFGSSQFGENGIIGFSETLHNNHDDMLFNNFSNNCNVGSSLGIDIGFDIDNVMEGRMDTRMGNNTYNNYGFDFGYDTASANIGLSNLASTSYGCGLNTIDPGRLDDFDGSQEFQKHRFRDDNIYGAPEDDQVVFDGDTTPLMKTEKADHEYSVSSPANDSEYENSDYEHKYTSKVPKFNKDGAPRKPRQPRSKLLKWSNDDWKNITLGLVWACGENGIQIPFDQAAQILGNRCTAGALQQALLKLRSKQIAEGYQIPSLKMAWTRKNKNSAVSSSASSKKSPEATPTRNVLPRKKPTLMGSTQSLIITLKRPYKEADRVHLDAPFKWAKDLFQKLKPASAVYDWNIMNSDQETTTPCVQNPSTPTNSITAEGYVAANLNSAGMPQGNGTVSFSNGGADMSRVSWEHFRQLEGDTTFGTSLEDFIYDDVFL